MPRKLQFAQTQVQYLGHWISEQVLHLHPNRFHGVLKPKTKCQLWGFLRPVGYCWNWIPNFSLMGKPLYVLLNNNNPDPFLWDELNDIDFKALKEDMMNPPALGHTHYRFPFSFFAYEKEGNTLGVLTQKHGDHHWPIRLLSPKTRPSGTELPPCLRAIIAFALLVKATEKILVDSL